MSIYGPDHVPPPAPRRVPPVVRSRGASALRSALLVALLLVCGALYAWIELQRGDDDGAGAMSERYRLQTAEPLPEPIELPAFERLQTAEILPPASSRAVTAPATELAAPPQPDALQTAAQLAEPPGRLQSASVLRSR